MILKQCRPSLEKEAPILPRIPLRIAGALFLCALLALASSYSASAQNHVELVILHTNDLHGHLVPFEDSDFAAPPETIGGGAYIASKIKELRAKYPDKIILLDAGDISQGTPLSNIFKGKPVIEYMNHLRYDAMSLGNHDFDWGLETLREIAGSIHFPMLCANVHIEKTGAPLPFTKPFVIVEREGAKIGIIGVITPHTPLMSFPQNVKGLLFVDPIETVRLHSEHLRSQGIKIIGVLSHLGLEGDRKLARSVPGLTFIIGGHSHNIVRPAVRINETVITQAGAYGKFLGVLRLRLDRETGKTIFVNSETALIPIINDDIVPDKEVEQILAPYRTRVDHLINETIGCAREDILDVPIQGCADTKIGNLVADMIRTECKADVVVYNSGGVRDSLYKGAITRGDIFNVLPFENSVITLDIKGSQLLDILDSLMRHPHYMLVSGMTFSYTPRDGGGGSFEHIMVGNRPLEKEKLYRLATVDFVFQSDERLRGFQNAAHFTSGSVVRDVIEKYIKRLKSIDPPTDGRIKILKSR